MTCSAEAVEVAIPVTCSGFDIGSIRPFQRGNDKGMDSRDSPFCSLLIMRKSGLADSAPASNSPVLPMLWDHLALPRKGRHAWARTQIVN